MSFSTPIELSIQMEEYMELTGLNRSELIKISLVNYLESKKSKKNYDESLEKLKQDLDDIKNMLSELVKQRVN